jgi:hypothetical protein
MKTTLDLPDELVRQAKLRAVMQGRTLRDLVADFLRQGLGLPAALPPDATPASAMVHTSASGLPVIRCDANAPASRMGLHDLLKLEQLAQTEGDMRHAGFSV